MTFTISILIKSTIILLLATALVLALKKSSASLRHLVISLSLFGLLLLPAFQYFTPAIEVEIPIVEQLELEKLPLIWEEEIALMTPIELVEKESPEFFQQDVYVSKNESNLPAIEPEQSLSFFPINMNLKEVLFWIWVVGCTLLLMRMLFQILHTWRINRKSQIISLDIGRLNLQLKRKVHFLSNSTIKTPMTFGFFPPKILLPVDAQNWSEEQLKIVLLHEIAHIKRYDYLLHLIGLLTLSLFWFHPLVWLLQKWQQSEREKACDEYVLKQGISKTNYAESLVNIARNMLSKKTHRWHSSLPMAASSETKKRVLAILKFDLQQWQFTRWVQWRWIVCFACVLPLLAAIHPTTKQIIEESIPKIEAVLEQPVFVPKVKMEEVEIMTKNRVQNSRSNENRVAIELVDTIARLPLASIQQINAKPFLPKMTSDIKKTQEKGKVLGHYGKWGNYDGRYVQVFTKGEFEIGEEYPYFRNLSENAVIIIELSDKKKIGGMFNRKEQRLVIKKANYNAWVTDDFRASDIAIKKGEVLFAWLDNLDRKVTTVFSEDANKLYFLGHKSRVKRSDWKQWMQDDISEIANTMRRFENEEIWQEVHEEQPHWQWKMILTGMEFSSHSWLKPMSEEDRKIRDQQRPPLDAERLREFLEKSGTGYTPKDSIKGKNLYGKWQIEDKEIEVWTKGEYNLINRFPYFKDLSSEAMIRIKVYERNTGKKYVLYVNRTPANGILLDSYKGKNQVPVPANTIVHSYTEGDLLQLSFPCFDCSYCVLPEQKKVYQKRRKAWQDMMIEEVVEALKDYENRDYIIEANPEHKRWNTIVNYSDHRLSPKYQLLQILSEEKWERYMKQYELQQMVYRERDRLKSNKRLQLELPKDYSYIPSGYLSHNENGQKEKVSIRGFHMSETEITNQQYREFLSAMERRGKIELLKKARIYNENWDRNYSYGEPMSALANTYHRHPAFNKYPVVNISYEGAKAYCQWMTELYNEANKNSDWQVEFRLPNKEEWMYAARGGHQLAYYPWGGYNVRNAKGCYLGNFKQIDESKLVFNSETNTFAMTDTSAIITGEYISAVGPAMVVSFFPNDYGLYHMSGNVAEMLQGKGSTKGGSWNSTGYHVRIDAEDEYAGWEEPNPCIGFRPIIVVRKR